MSYFLPQRVMSGKINKLRTLASGIVFIGFIIMYIGYAGHAGYLGSFLEGSMLFMTILFILGVVCVISSSILYAVVGLFTTRALKVACPTCDSITRMVGANDQCMYCGQKLTLDPSKAKFDPEAEIEA